MRPLSSDKRLNHSLLDPHNMYRRLEFLGQGFVVPYSRRHHIPRMPASVVGLRSGRKTRAHSPTQPRRLATGFRNLRTSRFQTPTPRLVPGYRWSLGIPPTSRRKHPSTHALLVPQEPSAVSVTDQMPRRRSTTVWTTAQHPATHLTCPVARRPRQMPLWKADKDVASTLGYRCGTGKGVRARASIAGIQPAAAPVAAPLYPYEHPSSRAGSHAQSGRLYRVGSESQSSARAIPSAASPATSRWPGRPRDWTLGG